MTRAIARWWKAEAEGDVACELCPRRCRIQPGRDGFCNARRNEGGQLVARTYGRPTGFAVDPIEKKPLAHFHPGMPVLSFGSIGCNLACRFCQNWSLSRATLDERRTGEVTPESVVEVALENGCPGISYTYNEPIVWGEFVIDCARLARSKKLLNVMVTNGFVSAGARAEIFADVDAANVDLKAFTDRFYRTLTGGSIEPVKDTLVWLVHETGVWVEITTLLIPGENDSDEELDAECAWIARELSVDVPVHFTAFHPDHRMLDKPITPASRLEAARAMARRHGLRYAFVGNVHGEEGHSTRCPGCARVVVGREWHRILSYDLVDDRCRHCGETIAGRFDAGGPSGGRPRAR